MKKGIIYLFVLLIISLVLLFFVRSQIDKTDMKIFEKDKEKKYFTLDITFLDIGQGDATFIEFPDGRQMLVDCAIDARVVQALGRVMDFYDRNIDYLIITHPHLDHYGGCVDVMRRFDIEHILYTGIEKKYDDHWNVLDAEMEVQKEKGVQFTLIEKPFVWDIAGTIVNILYPDHPVQYNQNIPGQNKDTDVNNTSVVIKLSYGDQDVLLMGDAEMELEDYLIATYGVQLDVEILKAGHHGSKTSSIQEFISSTSPNLAIFSVGQRNKFGHPSPRVLKRFERVGATILRTDISGDILVSLSTSSYYITTQF